MILNRKGGGRVSEKLEQLGERQNALLQKYAHLLRGGFRGDYQHGLDAKGRLIVPAPFRNALGDSFCICMTPDFKAIAVYPRREWELYYCSLLELAEKDMRMIKIINLFTKYTYEDCECDGQGRILLPQKLRTRFLQDARDVDVSGCGSHICIKKQEEADLEEEKILEETPDILSFEAEIAAR